MDSAWPRNGRQWSEFSILVRRAVTSWMILWWKNPSSGKSRHWKVVPWWVSFERIRQMKLRLVFTPEDKKDSIRGMVQDAAGGVVVSSAWSILWEISDSCRWLLETVALFCSCNPCSGVSIQGLKKIDKNPIATTFWRNYTSRLYVTDHLSTLQLLSISPTIKTTKLWHPLSICSKKSVSSNESFSVSSKHSSTFWHITALPSGPYW